MLTGGIYVFGIIAAKNVFSESFTTTVSICVGLKVFSEHAFLTLKPASWERAMLWQTTLCVTLWEKRLWKELFVNVYFILHSMQPCLSVFQIYWRIINKWKLYKLRCIPCFDNECALTFIMLVYCKHFYLQNCFAKMILFLIVLPFEWQIELQAREDLLPDIIPYVCLCVYMCMCTRACVCICVYVCERTCKI